jgi:hypothetical protein
MSRDRDFTQCQACGRRWTGKTECHCPSCHQHFGSPTAFDRHLVGGRCLPAHEMIEPSKTGIPRLTPTTRKTGTVWVVGRRVPVEGGEA